MPGGITVFTTHGQGSADTAERYKQYWLDKAKVQEALGREGYYYERYPYYYTEYGLTWFTPQAVEAVVAEASESLHVISYHPIALEEHQDLFVCRKGS